MQAPLASPPYQPLGSDMGMLRKKKEAGENQEKKNATIPKKKGGGLPVVVVAGQENWIDRQKN